MKRSHFLQLKGLRPTHSALNNQLFYLNKKGYMLIKHENKKGFHVFYKLILLAVMYCLSTCVNILRKRIWCTKKITQRDP